MTGAGIGLLIVGVALFIVVLYKEKWSIQVMLLPAVLIMVGVGCIVYEDEQVNHRLMDACRQDHKEYECVSMLERGH